MKKPEFSADEKMLLSALEPIVRKSVWSSSAKVFEGPYESEGKWIEYPLRFPGKKDDWGKYYRVTLKPENTAEEFLHSYCAFGANHLHTTVAVYRILRALKRRGLLNVSGFESTDV